MTEQTPTPSHALTTATAAPTAHPLPLVRHHREGGDEPALFELNRPHGYARYRLDGCRCNVCGWARYEYDHRRDQLIAQGKWEPFVDACAARDHVWLLQSKGMGLRRICDLTGLSRSGMQKLMGVSGAPSARIRPEKEALILSVRVEDVAPSSTVDAGPTWRRLHSLIACGYPKSHLAAALDVGKSLQIRTDRVLRRTADEVAALYERLENTPGPSDRARLLGQRSGWPTPDHWADVEAGTSYADAAGEVEDEDDLAFMLSTGASIPEAAERLGIPEDRVRARLAKRAERAA